jgi:hypothetical protein
MASDQIKIPDFDYEATTDDRMRVSAVVENERNSEQTVTLTMRVKAGEETHEESTTVNVGANGTAEADTVFDVSVEEFEKNGSLDFDWDTS